MPSPSRWLLLFLAFAVLGCGGGVRRDPLLVPRDGAVAQPDAVASDAPEKDGPSSLPDLGAVSADAAAVPPDSTNGPELPPAPADGASADGCGAACARLNGAVCQSSDQCQSRQCVDGRCCQLAKCAGDCNFCRGPEGTCQIDTSTPNLVAGCLSRHACDAQGACRMLEGQACAQDDQCLGGACGGGKCASELVILPELRMGGTVFAGQLGGILFNVWNRSGVEQAPFEMVLVASPPTLRFDWPEPSQPCGSSPLPHTGGCRVGVAGFLPSAGQSVSATVEARRGGRVLARARWSAEVVPAGAPELRGGDLGENPVGTSSRAQEVELFAGASAIRPTRYFIEGRDAAEFEVVHNLCPARLEAGAWCFITLELSPAALGTRSARLVVEGDGFRAAAPLLGYGIPKPP